MSGSPIPLHQTLIGKIAERFGPDAGQITEYRAELTLLVPRESLLETARFLRDDADLRFDVMAYCTAVDWLMHRRVPRFDMVYHLFSTVHHHRMRLKTHVPEDDCWSPSLYPVWKSCNFMERESYDMFGIEYRGHPDLRRILMPDDWEGWPLRKDFPMGGVKSFYFKRSTNPHAGEPPGLIPRIRVQEGDI
jgi:NADH-quinone oxidoreductase subunit C